MRILMAVLVALGAVAMAAGCTAPEQQATQSRGPAADFLAAGELPPEFRIERITPYPADNQAAALGIDVEISMPARLGEGGKFTITVNQQTVVGKEIGGGFDDGRSSHVFRVYPGEPGAKAIAVTYEVNGEVFVARQNHAFASTGDVLLLDHFAGELLLAPAELQLLNYFVSELKLTCNGAEVALAGSATAPGVGPARSSTATPALQAGRNELVLTWRDAAGAAQEKKFVLLYAPGGRIKVGEAVPFGFGYQGSRSGPFFQLEVTDSTVASVSGEQSVARFPRVADGQLTFGTTLQQTVTGLAPGSAGIVIMKSRYFLFPYEPEDTITMTVTP